MNEEQGLQRGLKNRHAQLISIGGTIETGLFLGSGKSIQLAGPSILLTCLITGCVCSFIVRVLGEPLPLNTNNRFFLNFVVEYLGKEAAFITGWTYWFCWVLVAMVDSVAIGVYVRYWAPGVSQWLPELITLGLPLCLSVVAVSLFGELEFWLALIKVVAITALILVGAYMILTHCTTDIGTASITNLWSHGGFSPTGAKGFILAFQMATSAFAGTELVGLVAGETESLGKVLLEIINNIPIWIILFYPDSLSVIITIYPWNSLNLDSSPFVEVFSEIGITIATSLINLAVLSTAASTCNSTIYSTRHMFRSLA